MRDLLIFLAVGLGTYAMRASFVAGFADRSLPANVQRWLGHARHAILAALTVGFLAGGHGEISVGIASVGAAAVVALLLPERRMLPLVFGLAVAFALTWI